ncbi:MAG: M28 family peptidase [Candidatus Aminicenantes bacterium]|nr:M28 family peptidase [Candidatus Aminicenantes bacterium]
MRLRRRSKIPIIAAAAFTGFLAAQIPPDRCLVPPSVRDPIINEFSGEQAFLHVQMLAANRNRPAAEYEHGYFETFYIRDQAQEAGLSDVAVEFFPSRDVWDAEEADLWLVEPVRKKLASLNQVPASLASGSMSADIEAEVVYVGPGREADYAGKDVAGKIVLGSGSVGGVFAAAVNQRGAAGALGTGSPGVTGNAAGYTLDQIGWSSVSPQPDKGGFGFSLSLRQFLELRGYLDRGQNVVVRAHVRTKRHPGKVNVIHGVIPGTDPDAGELLCVAHAFETIATPGANDNCTGVGTILEIGRTIARLVRDGLLPRPRRTIHFLWGNEISGSTAFMFKHPELQDKLLAVLNFDMTGANPKTTDSYLRMKMTPDGRPSHLNDLIANLLQFVDQAEIRTTQGANAQFNYRLCPPAAITSGSDHSVFLAAGIPAMQFNYWPDNFYHSSADRVDQADPTEIKRVGVAAAAAFAYLGSAGPAEARALAWEAAANGEKWIAEVARQSVRLLGGDPAKIHGQHVAARNKVDGAFNRAKGAVESVLALARTKEVEADVQSLVLSLAANRDTAAKRLEKVYAGRCAELKVKPAAAVLGEKEREYARLIPRRLFKAYSEEAQRRSQGQRGGQTPPAKTPSAAAQEKTAPSRPGAGGGRGMGFVATSVNYFIDGRRSLLDIYNAVRAECGNLQVGSSDSKYAYVLGPEYPDVALETVVAIIENLEKSGTIEILRPKAGKTGLE